MAKSIVLIGFMGAGKSSVGKRLAEKLGLPFIDTDARIEQKMGQTISDIFASRGETAFRELETALLQELATEPPAVVSTGGGIVTREENWPLLHALGKVVYLHATSEALFQRVSRQSRKVASMNENQKETRPLLLSENPRESFEALYLSREALYQRADLILDTASLPKHEIADEIIRRLAR